MRRQSEGRVAVVGVGSVGAMVLWQLARRGVEAVGYDAYAPGHDRGAAGGESRILRAVPRAGTQYVRLLRRARELWLELEGETDQRLFHPVGCVTVAPADHPDVSALQATAEDHGLPLELLKSSEAAMRVPEHPLREGEVLLLDRNGGHLRSEVSVLTAANRAEALGARIHRYTPVVDVRDDGDSSVVVTDQHEERYDRVIVAVGPWTRRLSSLAASPLVVRMVSAVWFARRSADTFIPEKTPVAMRLGDPEMSCCPSADGAKVVPRGDPRPDIGSPDSLPRTAASEVVAKACEDVRRAVPGLYPDPIRIGTYSDAYTADGHGLLGPAQDGSAVIVATAFSGRGFQTAPVLGEIAADLATNGRTSHDIGFLDPSRHERK